MRLLPVVAIPLCIAGFAGAQAGAPFSSQQNALGGQFAAAGMGRPLGGIAPSGQHRAGNQGARRGAVGGYVAPYGYSWYVPGLFDWSYATPSSVAVYGADTSPYLAPPPPVAAAPMVPPAPPVIINQYFGSPPPANVAVVPPDETPHTAGEPLAPVDNYYLIAYKDHSVYPAISYWVEDKTLHYVTTQNTHNQASLDLIDLNLTRTINQARNVPFSLPGQQ
ncbi:MAG TPA: hypothetical protein VEF06_10200 [Bryobacteraceae bacterium]|nr:hypothetical protein [Bryobacteraceae bacterium]